MKFFKDLKDKLGTTKHTVICVSIILAIIIIPSGIFCAVHHITPAQMITDMVTSNETQIVGKWQGEGAVTAYEFYDDGTFDSYISSFSYRGKYDIEGNKIILKNSELSGSVEYKMSINGDYLELKLIKENGVEPEEKTVTKYTKVDAITMQSLSDLIESLTTEESQE